MNSVLWPDSFTSILSKFRQVIACLSPSFPFTANGNKFHLSTIMKNAVRSIRFHMDECFHFSQVDKELLGTMVTPCLLSEWLPNCFQSSQLSTSYSHYQCVWVPTSPYAHQHLLYIFLITVILVGVKWDFFPVFILFL